MKMNVQTALLAMALSLGAVHSDTTPISTLSPSAISTLQQQVQQWKTSQAGRAAIKQGFVPTTQAATIAPTLTTSNVTAAELQRFHDSQLRLQQVQQQQRLATFSMQTPFAMLKPDEFAKWVGKSNVAEHRRRMQEGA